MNEKNVSEKEKQLERLNELKQEHWKAEEKERIFGKAKKYLNLAMEEYNHLNKEELALLDEIAFLSDGTTANSHAERGLHEREETARHSRFMLESEYEELDEQERKTKVAREELEEQIGRQQRTVYNYAED
ncbi:hypothetical protein ACYSNR_15920 [Enterococcus sp. LJL128]